MSSGFSGGCLCGAVRYTSAMAPQMVGHCYCVDCRKTSGTSHSTHAVVAGEALSVSGEVKVYDSPADSGNMVGRAFCPTCGSPIYSTNTAMPGMTFVRVSSFDDLNLAAPQMTVYAARAPSWARFDESGPVFEIMPDGGPQGALADK